jgi:hypothetical protein
VGVKGGQRVRLTTSFPLVSQLSRKYWFLDVSETCGPPQPVMGTTFLMVTVDSPFRCFPQICLSYLFMIYLIAFRNLVYVVSGVKLLVSNEYLWIGPLDRCGRGVCYPYRIAVLTFAGNKLPQLSVHIQ